MVMSFTELRDNKGIKDIYVLNKSNRVVKEGKGDIHLQVKSESGEEFSIIIPVTWVPINLCEQGNFRDIVSSPQFMKIVRLKFIDILTPDEAKEILSTEEAQAEYDRVIATINHMITPEDIDNMEDENTEVANPGQLKEVAIPNGVRPKVIEVIGRDDLKDEDRYTTIRNDLDLLTVQDCRYILKNTSYARLTKLITDKLVKLQSAPMQNS